MILRSGEPALSVGETAAVRFLGQVVRANLRNEGPLSRRVLMQQPVLLVGLDERARLQLHSAGSEYSSYRQSASPQTASPQPICIDFLAGIAMQYVGGSEKQSQIKVC